MPAALTEFLVMSFADGIGVAMSRLCADYDFPVVVSGALPSLIFLWFCVLSIPVGGMCVRFGRRRIALVSLLVTAVAMFLPVGAKFSPVVVFALSFALLGISNVGLQVSLPPFVASVSPPGSVMGRVMACLAAKTGMAAAGRQLLSLRVVQHPEYSAGGTRRGKIRDILFRNIRVTGPEMPVSGLSGHSADAAVRNVRIENLTFNGKKVSSVREMNLSVQDFADEPVFADEPASDAARYASTEMNRAPAASASEDGDGVRLLVLGNSIALHSIAPKIGWTNLWGMAASAPEKDFAHLVWRGLEERLRTKMACRIRNVYLWEKGYADGYDIGAALRDEIAWKPDYVVVAVGENAADLKTSSGRRSGRTPPSGGRRWRRPGGAPPPAPTSATAAETRRCRPWTAASRTEALRIIRAMRACG